MYGLRSYCDRDPEGNVTEIVIKEQVSLSTCSTNQSRQLGRTSNEHRSIPM